MYWLFSGSHSKSVRDHVPSVRSDLSSTGMWGLILRSTSHPSIGPGPYAASLARQLIAKQSMRGGDEPSRVHVMPIFDPVQHGAHRTDFGLLDRSCSFDIHNHAVVDVDQTVGRLGKERGAFARRRLSPAGDVNITARHWLAGSEWDVNLGLTSDAAPKAAFDRETIHWIVF